MTSNVKGLWLKPEARTYELRVKKLRSEVGCALIEVLTLIERFRARVPLEGTKGSGRGYGELSHHFGASWS